MIVDYSRFQTNDIIKIQAFVRGTVCRLRVEKMVEKLIDESLKRLGRPKMMRKGRGSITERILEIRKVDNDKGGVSSRNGSRRQLTKHNQFEHSMRSMSSVEIQPNDKRESFRKMNEESWHGSVSSIRSIFESKRDLSASGPARSWSKRKLDDNQEQEEKQEEQEQPPTIETPELAKGEEKDPENSKPGCSVKNMKLRSNATNHVSSSEQVLEEQEMRMNDEIQQLLKDIQRIGQPGKPSVEFGLLFDDEKVANYYEALVGTLKAAKKKKLITYEGQILLKGVNDKVVISII